MAEYEVTKRINAIVSVFVNADSLEEAEEKGKKKFNKGFFKSDFTYQDGSEALLGITNMDLWNHEIE
jgi:hypothetical protein